MKLSKHFKSEEFDCKDGNNGGVTVNSELIEVLEKARDYFKTPIIITSGIRNPIYNKSVGGAKLSMHVIGYAADIIVKGVSENDVYNYFDSLYPNKYGIGLYTTFVHIDVRKIKSRWNKK